MPFGLMATLFDYLPTKSLLLVPNELPEILEHLNAEIDARYEERRHDLHRPILPPSELFLRTEECFGHMKRWPRISVSHQVDGTVQEDFSAQFKALPDLTVDARTEEPLAKIKLLAQQFDGLTVMVAESAGRREALSDLLKRHDMAYRDTPTLKLLRDGSTHDEVGLTIGALDQGFIAPALGLQLICESDLFGNKVMQRRRRKTSADSNAQAIKNLTELHIGSPVVHLTHGVGRYRGLQSITHDGKVDEFLVLEYADKAKLYVPVSSLHLISRYSGTDEALAPLHRLGSEKWSVAKQKALEKIRDTAAELLEIYAKREAQKGFAHEFDEQIG